MRIVIDKFGTTVELDEKTPREIRFIYTTAVKFTKPNAPAYIPHAIKIIEEHYPQYLI